MSHNKIIEGEVIPPGQLQLGNTNTNTNTNTNNTNQHNRKGQNQNQNQNNQQNRNVQNQQQQQQVLNGRVLSLHITYRAEMETRTFPRLFNAPGNLPLDTLFQEIVNWMSGDCHSRGIQLISIVCLSIIEIYSNGKYEVKDINTTLY